MKTMIRVVELMALGVLATVILIGAVGSDLIKDGRSMAGDIVEGE